MRLVVLVFLAPEPRRECPVFAHVVECLREEGDVDRRGCVPVLDFCAGAGGCVGDSGVGVRVGLEVCFSLKMGMRMGDWSIGVPTYRPGSRNRLRGL